MNIQELQDDLVELRKFRAQLHDNYQYFNGMNMFRSQELNKTLTEEIEKCNRRIHNIEVILAQ